LIPLPHDEEVGLRIYMSLKLFISLSFIHLL
jgi:hypothetical protein